MPRGKKDKKGSGDKKITDDKTSGDRRMSGDSTMSGDRRMPGDKKKSRLRRMSSSIIKKLLVRRDSGYDSGDQGQQQAEADSPQRSLSLSSTSERLEIQDEVDEDAAFDSGDGGEVTEDESPEIRQLSNSERHLINIKFALLLEQHRTCHAVVQADIKEIQEMERKEEADEWRRRLEESQAMEPDLFPRRRRKVSSSSSSAGTAGSDYFDCMLEERRQRRQDSNWRRNWATRTSNRMYGGYRNSLDYCY